MLMKTPKDEKTTLLRNSMQRTSLLHGYGTLHCRTARQRRSVDVGSRSFVRDQWQPSMKGTRCKLSMTAPGQEPMHIFKPMGRRVMDCLHGIHWLQASQQEPGHKKLPYAHWEWPWKGEQWMLLKADVTKAHRRVKIQSKEWKYQVA